MSLIWDYFDKVVVRGDPTQARPRGRGGRGGPAPEPVVYEARCKNCPSTYKQNKGGARSIRYHLKTQHGTLYAKLVRDEVAAERQRVADLDEVDAAERAADALAFETPRKRSRRALFADANSDLTGGPSGGRKGGGPGGGGPS